MDATFPKEGGDAKMEDSSDMEEDKEEKSYETNVYNSEKNAL